MKIKNLESILKNYDHISDVDVQYYADDCETIEELEDALNEAINEIDVIFHTNAMYILKENDVSLVTSMGLAHEYGYTCENLNSELLATLLVQDMARDELSSLISDIEDNLEDN